MESVAPTSGINTSTYQSSKTASTDPDHEILSHFSKLGEKNKIEFVNMESEYSVTFAINGEDHTLGNILRHMITMNENVEFCGYTMPHPSLAKFHIRIQTNEKISAIEALKKGFADVREAAEFVKERFIQEYHTFLSNNMM